MLLLLGSRTKVKFKIGDSIEVFVTSVDIDGGKIDFKLTAEDPSEESSGTEDSDSGWEKRRIKNGSKKDHDKNSRMNKAKKGQLSGQKEKPQTAGEHTKKRGEDENDRSRVRKKRFPKRR